MADVVFRIKADGQQAVDALGKLDKALAGTSTQAAQAAAGLKAAEQATNGLQGQAAAAQLGALQQRLQAAGMSAAEAATKLRQVPMQMTDVVTSLTSGMSPLQVLIQQGGQLKDSFGSAGLAARAVGGYVASLVTPVSLAVAAVGALGVAWYQGSRQAEEFRRQTLLTGNAVGASMDQLAGLAAQTAAASGATTSSAVAAVAALVGTAAVARTGLVDYAQTAMAMEKSFGQSIETTAKHFSELGRDPVAAAKRLNETMNFLTASTYAQIRAAEQQGDKVRAAALAQDAYSQAMAYRAKQVQDNLGFVERAWNAVAGAAKGSWDAMLGLGRSESTLERLSRLQKQLQDRQESLDRYGNRGGVFGATTAQQVEALKQEISYLQETERLQRRAGDAAAERAATEKAGIEEVDRQHKAAEEVRKKAQQEQARLVEAGVRLYADLAAQQGGLAPDFAEKWSQLSAAFAAHKINTEQLTQAQAALLAQQPAMKKATEERARLEKQLADQQAQTLAESWKAVDAVNAQASQQARANATFGQGRTALAELTLAELEQTRAALEQTDNVIPGRIQALEQQIEAQRRLVREMKAGEALEASDKAARRTAEEWRNTAQTIERALTDALMRGFESGKGFVENFKDALVNMFKTLVLRPTVQALVTSVMGVGAAGSAMAQGMDVAGGMGNSLGLASSISNFYKSVTTGFAALGDSVAFAAQDMGAWLVNNTTGVLNEAGGALMQSASAVGTVASYAAGALAGYGIGKTISGQYSTGLGKNTLEVAGTAIGAIFGGPMGAAIGGAIGGLVNRAFGMKSRETSDYGLTGVLSSGGASVSQYSNWRQEGGWFRSDRSGVDYAGVDAQLQLLLDTSLRATTAATAAYARSIGLSASAVQGYAQAINLSLKGLDQAGQEKAIADALSDFGDGMVTAAYGQALQVFARSGEALSQTLVRLSTSLTTVNQVFDTLSVRLLDVGAASAEAASRLLDAFGGAQAFVTQTSAYYAAFYSDEERLATTTRQLRAALAELGVQMPQTAQGFRDLVQAQDLSSDEGRKTYAALLALTSSFKTVFDAQTKAAEEAAQAQRSYVQAMLDSGKRISAWISGLDASSAGLGAGLERTLQQARGSYLQALSLARGGDTAALTDVIGQAEVYLHAARQSSASSSQYQATLAQIKAELGQLPATTSYQQQTLAALGAINDTTAGVVDNTDALEQRSSSQLQALIQINNDGIYAVSKNTARALDYLDSMVAYSGSIAASTAKTAANPVVVNQSSGGGGILGKLFGGLFADGGVFDGQGVYSQVTPFLSADGRLNVMGEAGPEAVMPLKRLADGALGVRATQRVVLERYTTLGDTQALQKRLDQLIDDGRAQAAAMVTMQARMARLFERWELSGMPETRETA